MRSVPINMSIAAEDALQVAENQVPSVMAGEQVPELDGNQVFESFDILRPLVSTGGPARIFANESGLLI